MKIHQPRRVTNRITLSLLSALALFSTAAFAAELKFEVVPNFFEATPDNQPLGACHGGLVVDKAGPRRFTAWNCARKTAWNSSTPRVLRRTRW